MAILPASRLRLSRSIGMISFFRGSPGLAEGRPRLARVDRVRFLDSRGKSQSMADCLDAAFPGFGQAVKWSGPDPTGRARRVERPRRTIDTRRPDHKLPGRSVKAIMVDVSKMTSTSAVPIHRPQAGRWPGRCDSVILSRPYSGG